MSRLIISNIKKAFENIKNNIHRVGFPVSQELNGTQHLAVFKKFRVDNCNFYEKDGDWVAVAGTFIYSQKIGKEALKLFLKDAKKLNITELRKKTYGVYTVAYKLGKYIYVYIDETQLNKFHYYIQDNKYILTNDATHLYNVLHTNINPTVAQLHMHITNFTAEDSLFKDIKRLMADECIKIDTTNDVFSIEKVNINYYKFNFKSRQEARDTLVDKMKEHADLRKKLFKDFSIFQTGGTYCRIILASYLSNNTKPKLINWVCNNYCVLPTKEEDTKICKEIAKKYNLEAKVFNLSSNYFMDYCNTNIDDYWRDGDYVGIYGNNKKFKENIFKDIDTEFCDFGYFGETLRQLDELETDYSEPFTLNDLVTKLFFRKREQQVCFNDISETRKQLYDIFLRYAKANNMNEQNLTKQECFSLWSYRRTIVDIVSCLLVNLTCYSYPVLAQKEIYDLINQVNIEWKKDAWFQLAITKKLSPQILDIPILSHCSWCDYDAKTNTLKTKNNKRTKPIAKNKQIENALIYEFACQEANSTIHQIGMQIEGCREELFSETCFLYFHKLVNGHLPKITKIKLGFLSVVKEQLEGIKHNITITEAMLFNHSLGKIAKFRIGKKRINIFYLFNQYVCKFIKSYVYVKKYGVSR